MGWDRFIYQGERSTNIISKRCRFQKGVHMVGELYVKPSITTGCKKIDGKRFFQYHGKWYDQKKKAEQIGKKLKQDYGYEYHILPHQTFIPSGGSKMNYLLYIRHPDVKRLFDQVPMVYN